MCFKHDEPRDTRWVIAGVAVALLASLTCAYAPPTGATSRDIGEPAAVTSDADLAAHLTVRQERRTRLYRHATRREWAGAAAALIELRSRPRVTTRPAAGPAPSSSSPVSSAGDGSVWDRLAQCESGGNWSIATGNGYYGGLQWLPSTFAAYGGVGMPHQASREQQIAVAERLLAASGGRFTAWPGCRAKLGLP